MQGLAAQRRCHRPSNVTSSLARTPLLILMPLPTASGNALQPLIPIVTVPKLACIAWYLWGDVPTCFEILDSPFLSAPRGNAALGAYGPHRNNYLTGNKQHQNCPGSWRMFQECSCGRLRTRGACSSARMESRWASVSRRCGRPGCFCSSGCWSTTCRNAVML